MRKGVSTTIITILVMLITVSLILISYNWLLKYSPQTQWELEKGLTKEEGCLKIENIDAINGKITIRNCGSVELSDFNVYLDSEKVTSDDSVLRPGGITQIELSMSDGDHEISISSDNAISSPVLINVFSFYCTGTQPPKFGDWIINDDTYCYCLSGRNITLTGNLRVSGSGSITIDNCILWLNQTNQDGYQYQFTFDDTSRTTITNSILNSSKYFHPYWRGNSVNYFENVIFDRPHSGSAFQFNSINTFVNTQFIRQVVFDQNSKSTIINSRKVYSEANSLLIYGASPELNFSNSETIDWDIGSTNGIIRGNYTITGSVKNWPIWSKVTRYFPTVVKYLDGSPVTGTANITNKTGNLIWQGNIVNGYVEPVITFNNTTYGPGNFTLYVTDGLRTNSKDVNFLTNTSISLTLSYCDFYIFNPSDTYTIYDSGKIYCLSSNINIAGKNAINFNSGVQNTILDCLGYSINGDDSYDGIYLTGSETKNNKINNCSVNNYNYAIHITGSSTNNIVVNSTAKSSYVGLHLEGNTNNNIVTNNIFDYNSVGIAACGAYYNTFIDNTANHNTDIGFWCNGCSYSNITGRSIWNNTNHDYYYPSSGGSETVNFTNTNFTGERKIYFPDSYNWFIYNNESTGNIWLKTNAFSSTIITRKLTNWNNTLIQWNDTSNSNIVARYNITGLLPNTNYSVYDNGNSVTGSPFNSSSTGEINFTISLPAGQQHNIKVEKPAFDFNNVIWFKLDDGEGTKIFDSSFYQNNGSYYGESFNDATLGNGACDPGSGSCPERVSGYFGKALDFDGMDDYVIAPSSASFDVSNITITAWIYPRSFGSASMGRIFERPSSYIFYVANDSGSEQLRFYHWNLTGSNNGGDSSSSYSIDLNTWQHVAVVYNGTNIRFFVDGAPRGSPSTTAPGPLRNLNDLYIGNRPALDRDFNGTIDELRIWNRTLNQTEIQAEMQNSMPVARPIASWRFDESDLARYVNDTHIWVNGTNSSALSFDGVNDFISISDNGHYDNMPQITFMAWFKLDQLASVKGSSQVIMTKKHSTSPSSSYYIQQNSDNTIYCVMRNSTGNAVYTQTEPVSNLGRWYHAACVYNGTFVKIYLNGTPGAFTPQYRLGGSLYDSDFPLRIGTDWEEAGFLKGTIDEVRIWNRSLTQAEIQAEMNSD